MFFIIKSTTEFTCCDILRFNSLKKATKHKDEFDIKINKELLEEQDKQQQLQIQHSKIVLSPVYKAPYRFDLHRAVKDANKVIKILGTSYTQDQVEAKAILTCCVPVYGGSYTNRYNR